MREELGDEREVFWWLSGLRIWHSCCYGVDLIPAQELPQAEDGAKKKNNNNNNQEMRE